MLKSLISRYSFLFLAVVLMWVKTYIVYQTGFDIKIENMLQSFILFMNPLSFFLLIFGFGLFMKQKARNIYILVISTLVTIILISNMIFYGFYNDFLTIPLLFQSSNMGDLDSSVQELVDPIYFLLFIDILLLLGIALKHKFQQIDVVTSKERKAYFLLVLAVFVIHLGLSEISRPQLLTRSFDREVLVKNIGIFNFHIYDAVVQSSTSAQRVLADSDELVEIQNYIKANKKEPDEKMFGIAKDRNVIFVSLESTQSFVVNETLNGEELTPYLNDFINESYYFENFYHQTEQGKTSDSEFLVTNSLYPLGRGAVFFTHNDNEYNSMQEILKEKHYYSATFHANNASFWNRDIMYEAFGVDKFYDLESYDVNEENSTGWGLKDKEYFEQSVDLMSKLPQPFYSYFITLTNHFPFELDEEDKLIDEFDSTSEILNRYVTTIRYQDEALKRFIEKLKESGLYDNSIIVLMGDHYGISQNHNEAMAKFLGKEEITAYDNVQLQRVPFVIHMPGITDENPKLITDVSGQIDIKPTLLHLLGIDTTEMIQFGNDLFSPDRQSFAVLRNGSFITEKYISISDVCYDRQTQEVIEAKGACDSYEEIAHSELSFSDKIIYGDLLRFYNEEKASTGK
ncbi:phosphoglycerol transferase MdoB-like AlkP superfamily enzyme [Metabacillus crassostreae]|uniref:LTA synthase family protein n=1 Tax=Metabacillus crassostreae TaxID=929098 RepID=UPI00195C73A9|nr:LTA synthase family protein [Metabacillus crassostreae]MBM7605927.1 phosphoglycerol transferase MdoB-like AlkP superfamily enzyme [Metabacillus crassostreae]